MVKKFMLLAVLSVLTLSSCKIDRGLSPDLGVIKGKIYFSHRTSEILKKTDEIRVAVAKSFPPAEFTELITSPPLNKWGGDTLEYELYVPFGTYNILGVVWKAKGKPWNLSDVMGYYHDINSFLPSPITVTRAEMEVDSINVYADFDYVIREASICGKITYSGTWPKETEIMGIGAFKRAPDPNNIFSLLNVSSAKIGIPIFVSEFNYCLPLSAGTYQYIGLFWKAKGTPFTSIYYLGFYADPDSASKPGAVTVVKGETRSGIDIHVDFSTFHP
ncbi:hypothetical protein BMS3Abin05_00001 [bacterium BMS3Abin05]|nr:hypothetical protein BMS3Abin05_00001 [bacterium BMS3Abin05]GBE28033.1 hypothetical protein BMS3Bbin03_01969 [bacterium BMS3Bbin03]